MEAVGIKLISPVELRIMEENLSRKVNKKVNLDIWYQTDTVITDKGYISFEEFSESNIKELDEYL